MIHRPPFHFAALLTTLLVLVGVVTPATALPVRETRSTTVHAIAERAIQERASWVREVNSGCAQHHRTLHRWYDPSAGRFISRDPIGFAGGTANLYQYVGGNPVNFRDPLGLEPVTGAFLTAGYYVVATIIASYGVFRGTEAVAQAIQGEPLSLAVGTAGAGAMYAFPPSAVAIGSYGLYRSLSNFNSADPFSYLDTASFVALTGFGASRCQGGGGPSGGTGLSRRSGVTPASFEAAVPIPEGWNMRAADSGKGVVYQRPGATGNADSIRVMNPTDRYPNGYLRYYNSGGQPLDLNGRPTGRGQTHIPLDSTGSKLPWPW